MDQFQRLICAVAAWGGPSALLLLASLVLGLVAVGTLLARRPSSVPRSFDAVLAPAQPPHVFLAGRWLPEAQNREKYHQVIEGTTRSGKSIFMSLYMRSVLPGIRPGSDRRLCLIDPKNELHAALFADAAVQVHFLLLTDLRSSWWDLAADFTSPAAVDQLCHALVPEVQGDSNPFFTRALRELLNGVITSLNATHPKAWRLADVVHILEDSRLTAEVLGRTPQTRSKLRLMGEAKTWNNILATLETELNRLRLTAACWSRARRRFSLKEFVDGESIVVVGRDPKFAALLDPLNVLFFTQLCGRLLAQKDSETRRTYLVIDEVTVAGGEDRALPGLRDICERGASRGTVVTIAYLSYAAMKDLYKDAADAILGMLQNQVFLRAGDEPTAQFASKAFGKRREWIEQVSDTTGRTSSWGPGGGGSSRSSSTTKSEHWHESDLVPYERFLELRPPTPETGITAYRLTPDDRSPEPFHLPGRWVAENLPRAGADAPAPYLMRPDHHQVLAPLSFADLRRLRLPPPEDEREAEAVHPKEALSRPRERPGSLPAPRAQDDLTGKLRWLVGCPRTLTRAMTMTGQPETRTKPRP